ncbi:MAG: hypothetical protein N3B12_00370 [Armatimonadetes bacterium]|nr:hypothetical protein [Armatimonadota bacterium]
MRRGHARKNPRRAESMFVPAEAGQKHRPAVGKKEPVNQDALWLIFPLVFGAIFVAVPILAVYTKLKRGRMFLELANRMGWHFSSGDPFDIPSAYKFFDRLNQGENHKASNVIWSSSYGLDFQAFGYDYLIEGSEGYDAHRLTAIVVQARFPFKPISIRPKRFGHRLAKMVGFQDIDFEWDEFNRAFRVTSADKEFAYEVVNQRTIDLLMQYRRWSVDVFAQYVLVYTGKLFGREDYAAGLGLACGFVQRLPRYLADKLRSQ